MNENNEQTSKDILEEKVSSDETENKPEEIKISTYIPDTGKKETVYLNEGISTEDFRNEFGISSDKPEPEPVLHGTKDSSNTRVYVDSRYSTSDYQYQTYDTYDTNENYRTNASKSILNIQKISPKKKNQQKRENAAVLFGSPYYASFCH